ncbi:50S ribosomal protein L19 [Candidatus Peregrinibacteria bacterium CG_4_10_14_0_2_um_filter_38_24]|nr:MAG: 50S ribosomal protein L19 [Candidatus Peregrinibacteria bacterium CG_4_10_14_0_2_um_filter_38_24]PJC39222.1 MAG: 50S ribosomal protein L19 [Candidatus Peregrinibacteria bacterium CG_4_9_14_0_2_um_filter_38_9]
MNIVEELRNIGISDKKIPEIKAGDTVKVYQKIKEGDKERIQAFEGLVIAVSSGTGVNATITVRKIVQGVGVEKVIPVYSTNVEKIEVKKRSKVRRAKLYYMRERTGKSARLKETLVSDKEFEKAVEELAIQKAKEEARKAKEEGSAPVEEAVTPIENEVISAEVASEEVK